MKETIALDLGNGLEQVEVLRHLGSGGFFDSYHVRLQEGRPDWPEELVLRFLLKEFKGDEFVHFLKQIDSARKIVWETREALGDLLARPCFSALETKKFMLNEFIPGETLAEYLLRQLMERDEIEAAIKNIRGKLIGVIDIVEKLRSNGLMHGDLSINNIIITPENSLRLIDWDGIIDRKCVSWPKFRIYLINKFNRSEKTSDFLRSDELAVPIICAWLIVQSEQENLDNTASVDDDFLQTLLRIVNHYCSKKSFELNELRDLIGNP